MQIPSMQQLQAHREAAENKEIQRPVHGEVVLLEEQVPKSIAAMSAFESNGLDSAVASRAVDEGHVVRVA